MQKNRKSLRNRISVAILGIGLAGGAPASAPGEPPASLVTLDSIAEAVEQLVREARFHTAIGVARSAHDWSEACDEAPELRAQCARLEILTAKAHLALEQHERARDSLRRALVLNPDLSLDGPNASPELLEVLRTLRPPAAPRESDA